MANPKISVSESLMVDTGTHYSVDLYKGKHLLDE